MNKISVIIIAKNEETDIRECLESVNGFDEIVLIDSGSTDKTVQIAGLYTDKIYKRDFDDFSSQKNFGVSKAKNDWILSLDADERLSPKLSEELLSVPLEKMAGYRIKRSTYIFGKLMRYGGHQKDFPLRLFDRRRGSFVQPIHEYVKTEGEVGLIHQPLLHYSSRNLKEYFEKLMLYTGMEARYASDKAALSVYARMIVCPLVRFTQRYILELGFLDGPKGLLFYLLSSFYELSRWFKLLRFKLHRT